MQRKVPMHYNNEDDRWYVRLATREVALHCGEFLQIILENCVMPCRIELDESWYIIMAQNKFILHPRERYTVVI